MNDELADGLLKDMGNRVPSKLIDFGRALDSASVLSDGWAYFLEKPWKWAPEYTKWANLGYPQAQDACWAAFMDALDSVAL